MLSEPEEKEFSKEGATITLTDEFTEKDLVSQTAYYESMDSIVVMLKEEFTLFEEAGYEDMTLSEYADLVIQANSLSAERKEEEGLTCFTYEKEQNGKNFEYYATVFSPIFRSGRIPLRLSDRHTRAPYCETPCSV